MRNILTVTFLLCTIPTTAAPQTPAPTNAPLFKDQTLGESWEDFVRIAGINVSTCMVGEEPAPLEWCETFKKIETGESATLSVSTPSLSLSMVFSEKKLIQILLLEKADWAEFLAEYTQTYGLPATQSENSAVWSFADGGEMALYLSRVPLGMRFQLRSTTIAASGQPGNLINVNFYSKDGKPKEQETPQPQSEREVPLPETTTQSPSFVTAAAPATTTSNLEASVSPQSVTSVRSISYTSLPYYSTTVYQISPGSSTTTCNGATCNTIYQSPQQGEITWRTIYNYNLVEGGGYRFDILCTGSVRWSKCATLTPGSLFPVQVEGNHMWVTAYKNGNSKKPERIKYDILQVAPAR